MRKKIFYTALSLALLLVAGCSDKEDMGMGPVVPEDQFDNIPGAPEEALTLARVMTEEGYTYVQILACEIVNDAPPPAPARKRVHT